MSFFGFGRKNVATSKGQAGDRSPIAARPAKTEGLFYGLNIKPEHGYYVEVEPLDGDIKQIKLADESDDGGYPARGIPILAGRHVDPVSLPTKMKWLDRRGHPVPDFDNGLINNVSSRARDIIESLEPGVHQFLPVDYFTKDGNFLESRYFFFVGNRLDTMYDDNPTMVLAHGRMWVPAKDLVGRGEPLPPGKDATIPAKLIVDSEKVGQAKIWSDKHLAGSIFISEEIVEAATSAGLTGLKPTPAETV